MPEIRGTVEVLKLGRDFGTFQIKLPGGGPVPTLILYEDTEVDMIDPTEMVRRNWMIGLLEQSLTHGLEVTARHPSEIDARVEAVILHTTVPKKAPPAVATTKGLVKKIEVVPHKGLVTIHGTTTAPLGQPPGPPRPEDHDFLIYADDGAGVIHPEESNRRNRIIGLLRQALADGLEVSVTHALKPNPLISGVILHAKE